MHQPLETLNLIIGLDQFRAIADREFHPYGPTIEMVSANHKTNPEIVALGQALANQLLAPRNGSGLYVETLWTQLAIQLLWNFSSLPRPRQAEFEGERLSDARVQRVIDFLRASLAEEISLGDLANLAGLSPNYFLSAFKRATGKTPHRILTEFRLAKACELLRNPQIPLVNVALAVGFSSQSHFTTVFGRFMKATPAIYRRDVLNLRQP